MRRCYLHIGTHKTGTSTIQLALSRGPQQVAEAGFHFPLTGRLDPDSGQHRLALPTPEHELYALMDSLIDEIRFARGHVILSSEEFSHMLWRRPEQFQCLVDKLAGAVSEIIVVLYLRRQTDFIASNYQERLKSRFCLDFSAYANARLELDLAEFPLDYAKLLKQLDRITGIEKVVRSYDERRVPSILSDFLQVIDWPERVALPEDRINTSTPLVEQLKNFYRAQSQREATRAEERLIEVIAQSLPERPEMAATTRNRIIERFAASNAELAAQYGLHGLREESAPSRDFGLWCGLGPEPPPDQNQVQEASLDNLFSHDFVSIVKPVADLLHVTQSALEQAQSLAVARHHEIETLRQQLDSAKTAIGSKGEAPQTAPDNINAPRAKKGWLSTCLGRFAALLRNVPR